MTLASDLAHLVGGQQAATPGVVHDPMMPLVLGNAASGFYTQLNYDNVNKRMVMVVYNGAQSSTYTFNSAGIMLINGVGIGSVPEMASAVAAAEAAAAQAATSAVNAATASTNAADSDSSAQDALTAANNAASNAANAATLSLDYAQAPASKPLPSGGVSSLVSALAAETVAVESRYVRKNPMDLVGNETFSAADLWERRDVVPVGAATVVLTIPPDIFKSTDSKEAHAAFRLASNATGSLQVVPAAAGSDLVSPAVVASGFAGGYREPTIPGTGDPIVLNINVPAVTYGRLVLVPCFIWNESNPALSLTLTANQSLTLTARRAQTTTYTSMCPSYSLWDAPLIAFTAKTVQVTMDPGVNGQVGVLQWFVLEGTTDDAPVINTDALPVAQTYVEYTLPALAARSRVLACAEQRTGIAPANSQWSGWSTNMTGIAHHSTAALPNATVSDTNGTKNAVLARGNAAPSVAGNFAVRANFTQGLTRPNMILFAYPPKTAAGGGTVVLEKEGGRDTLTVPGGEMILTFYPDGRTVHVSTPKP